MFNIKKMNQAIKYLEKIEMVFAIIIVEFIVLINLLEIIGRYFFSRPLGWAHELSLYLIIWFTYFAVSILIKRRELIAVDYFYGKFSNNNKQIITIGYEIILLITTMIMIYYSFELEKVQRIRNLVTLDITQAIGLYGFIIASFSIVFTVLLRLYKYFILKIYA